MQSEILEIPNWDGWLLQVKRSWCPKTLDPTSRPVVLIPGFGNNARIFAFPDDTRSMEGFFVRRQREVWSVNLRGQGASKCIQHARAFDVSDMALTDLGRVLDTIVERTYTSSTSVDGIGASLGGAILYIHSSMRAGHRLASMVGIGSPLRWDTRHPLFAKALQTSWIGKIPVRGSRLFLKAAFPLFKRFPKGIQSYIHPEHIASSDIQSLIATVDDPNRHVTQQLAEWIATRDLIIHGANVTDMMQSNPTPLLCVLPNRDGIVPAQTALSVVRASGAKIKDVCRVGDERMPFAHTDPFVHKEAPERVFKPVAEWLEALPQEDLEQACV